MHPVKTGKVESVVYVIGNHIHQFEDIITDNELRAEVELKHQSRRAEERIREIQKENNLQESGYYISAGIVYKVFHMNTLVKKITGDEAKKIKRLVKLELDQRRLVAADEQAKKAQQAKESECAKDERFALQA